ncbi:hypothetical protein CVT26_010561 [Gymnopilus dilepis]|uniref:Uncharacterized protein n=1 Tax=Gymnopilus dilepis TaxID=231916 RepID=A0A409WZF4_9AGAR|nr:hypothetical protein CVT26_010561 [Gymnopilus dilepis]
MDSFKTDFEKQLIDEQLHAANMTTFRPYPFPGRLVEIPYPLSEQGRPLAPHRLPDYCRTHQFDLPSCFHGKETKLTIKDASEAAECYVTLECNVRTSGEEPCPFLINLSALLRDDDDYMEFCLYRRLSDSRKRVLHCHYLLRT